MSNIKNYLKSWAEEVIKTAKKNLRSGGKGGGDLENSLDYTITEQGENLDISFFMNDYGTFVDKGVKGAGGEIKTGKHKGKYGGRRWFITHEGNRKDSPYQFGSGKSSGSIYKGIGSFIRKKGLQPRSEGGQYMTTKGLKIAIVKVLWVKGIHGISFFQNSLMLGMKNFKTELGKIITEDFTTEIKNKWQQQ